MKKILIIGIGLLLLTSCEMGRKAKQDGSNGSTATVETTTTETETVNDDAIGVNGLLMAEGYVRDRSDDECGFLIEILTDNGNKLVEPLTIPDEHKVDGKHVKLTYRMSRRQSKCANAMPIVIEKIIG